MATKVKQKPSGSELQVIPAKPGRKAPIGPHGAAIEDLRAAAVAENTLRTPSESAVHDMIAMALNAFPQRGRPSEDLYLTALEQIRMLEPRDGMEAQICTMMVGALQCSMETMRRANDPKQPSDIAAKLRNSATRLVRTYADLADLLDRHRNKNTQKIVVQHQTVMVNGDAQVAQITGQGESGS
ncbi:hypothetical protein [Thiomonas sp.]